MKRLVFRTMALVGVLALASSDAFGVTLSERYGIQLHALVSTVYQYSFNSPNNSDKVPVRVNVNDPNDISLNQASLFVLREKEGSPWGAAFTLDFGRVAETTAADWDGDGLLSSSEETNSFELREAYVTYTLEGFGGVTLKGGKFVTHHGYEVIKTWDTLNHNISHSILFGFSIPFTHTGFMATIPLGEMVSLDLGIVNGWDNVDDNNDGKSFHGGLGIEPSDMMSMYVSGIFGQEQNSIANGGAGAGSRRWAITANTVLRPIEDVAFVLDGTYAQENDVLPGRKNAEWYGAAAYGIVQLTDRVSVAVRSEFFVDSDGVRLASALANVPSPSGRGVTVWEVTPTLTVDLVPDYLTARFEYRRDEASQDIFPEGKVGTEDTSNTIAFELIGRI
ncbi:MAG: hypothetical protein KatS3mg076_1400 [Candidatus Binatia bacterium]|nr:MAG: hypothetical protein KatS3mg076_1400 [Candidatus Binatia bacterium]